MDHPFRGAAFGGFNRQDVLTYLENTARETAQQRQALEQQLEQQRQAASGSLYIQYLFMPRTSRPAFRKS